MESLLYVKYGVVAILVLISLGLTFLAIRKLADFLIGMLAIGAIIAISTSIYNGSITTWPEIMGASIFAGFAVGLMCAFVAVL